MSIEGRTSPPSVSARMSGRTRLFCAAELFAAAGALFILPFAHGPSRPVVSVSYAAGADNRLATVGLALVSLLTLAAACRAGVRFSPIRCDGSGDAAAGACSAGNTRIAAGTLWGGIAVSTVFALGLGLLLLRSNARYGDVSYFLDRTRDLADFHLRLYRDLEFTYGPLLLLPAVWLHALLGVLGLSVPAAYFLSFAGMNALGLAMLAWLLNRLPLTRRWRTLLFVLFVAVQMHPLEAANYSFFKFAAPPFLFLVAVRQTGWLAQAVALFFENLLVLLISPEMAIGTAGATGAYALLLLLRREWSGAALLLTSPAAVAVFLAWFGRGFIDRLAHASAGALNLVPEPMPHLFILGFAVAWLAPVLIGSRLRDRCPDAPVLTGLFVLALGMLPGALGRCDPLHVFFNGLTMFILSAVAVQHMPGRRLWGAALVVLAVDVQAVNYRLYGPSLLDLLHPNAAAATIDVGALRAATGSACRVATPDLASVPLPVEMQLRRAGLFQPEFYPGLVEVWDEAAERRKVAIMHRSEWMLAPPTLTTYPEPLPNTKIKRLFRFGYSYPQRRAPFVVGRLLNHDLQTNWTPEGTFGGLVLYHRKPGLGP